MDDQIHKEIGERGSDDVRAIAVKDGIELQLIGEEDAYSRLTPAAALRLGEWLIAQAIAQGARL